MGYLALQFVELGISSSDFYVAKLTLAFAAVLTIDDLARRAGPKLL
jgi:hypothetical protein